MATDEKAAKVVAALQDAPSGSAAQATATLSVSGAARPWHSRARLVRLGVVPPLVALLAAADGAAVEEPRPVARVRACRTLALLAAEHAGRQEVLVAAGAPEALAAVLTSAACGAGGGVDDGGGGGATATAEGELVRTAAPASPETALALAAAEALVALAEGPTGSSSGGGAAAAATSGGAPPSAVAVAATGVRRTAAVLAASTDALGNAASELLRALRGLDNGGEAGGAKEGGGDGGSGSSGGSGPRACPGPEEHERLRARVAELEARLAAVEAERDALLAERDSSSST